MFKEYMREASRNLIHSLDDYTSNDQLLNNLQVLYEKFRSCISQKGIVYFFGNGGSAAESSHIAAEFTSFCKLKHEPWGAVCLNDSISALTAIPNDFQFEELFARQVKALVKPNDIVIGLSTSGSSLNVLKGLDAATSLGAYSVLLTSIRSSSVRQEFNLKLVLMAPSVETTRIQEIHLHWLHAIIECLEINA